MIVDDFWGNHICLSFGKDVLVEDAVCDELIDLIGAGAILTWLFIKERNTSYRMSSQSSLSKV